MKLCTSESSRRSRFLRLVAIGVACVVVNAGNAAAQSASTE